MHGARKPASAPGSRERSPLLAQLGRPRVAHRKLIVAALVLCSVAACGVTARGVVKGNKLGLAARGAGGNERSLTSGPLQPSGSGTGFTGTGSCSWSPDDSGYHSVCVKMSDKFLKASASKDGNDLSSVVKPGGRWCVCAWAFASAVKRNPALLEGIELDCSRTTPSFARCTPPTRRRTRSCRARAASDTRRRRRWTR